MQIVGVSFDDPAENLAWSQDEGFQFELWSDNDDRTLALTYQAARSTTQAYASRITVILDADGVLTLQYLQDVEVGTHPALVLEDCQALFGGG